MVTVAINGPKNENLSFPPIKRTVRGTCDLNRDPRAEAKAVAAQFGVVPGQRIGVTDDGVGFIEDALYEDEHEIVREKIEAKGFKLPPKVEEFDGIDTTTWHWYLKRAVDNGYAQIVAGKFPKIDEAKVKKNWFLNEPESSTDKLTAALNRQCDVFEKLIEKLTD